MSALTSVPLADTYTPAATLYLPAPVQRVTVNLFNYGALAQFVLFDPHSGMRPSASDWDTTEYPLDAPAPFGWSSSDFQGRLISAIRLRNKKAGFIAVASVIA